MDYFIKSTIVIGLFYLCYILFLKRETFFQQNRWFLIAGLLMTVTLPLVVIPIEIPIQPTIYSTPLEVSERSFIIEETSELVESFNWLSFLKGVYLLGLIVFLVQFVMQFGSLVILLLKNPKLKDGLYTYVIVNNRISPFSFFKWIVYNPNDLGDEELNLMLTHEKIHVNQMHSLDIIIVHLASSVFWFNPLIWLYRKDLKQNLEYIADSETQKISNNQATYQRLLLKASIANHNIALTNNFYNSLIKKRIVMLQKSKSKSTKQWRYLLMLPVLAVVLMSMNTEEVYVEIPGPKTTENTYNSIDQKIEIRFSKNTSDKQLEKITKELAENGITMIINELDRNDKGEIISIDIDFKTKNGSANYNVSDTKGIHDFYFSKDDDGSFGVGRSSKNEVVIVEGYRKGKSKKKGQNVFIHKDDEIHEIIIEDSTNVDVNVDVIGGKSYVYRNDGKAYIYKDKDNDNTYHIKVDSSDAKVWTNAKGYSYVIGSSPDSVRYEAIKIKGGKLSDTIIRNTIRIRGNTSEKNPLYIINGKPQSKDAIELINPDEIDKINVLKGDNAISIYGYKAKDGAIIIDMKDKSISADKIVVKGYETDGKKNKWVVGKPKVSSIVYIDDVDDNKNATLAYITKNTSNDILDQNKALLKKAGITVKYSKIRRNKAGDITSIKITVKNDKGNMSSASWKDDDGIPSIEYGISEGSLMARTSEMND